MNWRQCGILWPKEICFSEHRATDVSLLYPKVPKNFGGDIPIDVPTNQNIGGDVSPASPAALTPVLGLAVAQSALETKFLEPMKH